MLTCNHFTLWTICQRHADFIALLTPYTGLCSHSNRIIGLGCVIYVFFSFFYCITIVITHHNRVSHSVVPTWRYTAFTFTLMDAACYSYARCHVRYEHVSNSPWSLPPPWIMIVFINKAFLIQSRVIWHDYAAPHKSLQHVLGRQYNVVRCSTTKIFSVYSRQSLHLRVGSSLKGPVSNIWPHLRFLCWQKLNILTIKYINNSVDSQSKKSDFVFLSIEWLLFIQKNIHRARASVTVSCHLAQPGF